MRFQRSLTIDPHLVCNHWAWIRDGCGGSVAEPGHTDGTGKKTGD